MSGPQYIDTLENGIKHMGTWHDDQQYGNSQYTTLGLTIKMQQSLLQL
jgi:hypothetical protein